MKEGAAMRSLAMICLLLAAVSLRAAEPAPVAAPAESAFPALVTAMGDADFDVREQAQEQLLAGGRAAWEFLKSTLPKITDAESQRRCAGIIFELDLIFESSETLSQRAAAEVTAFHFETATRYVSTLMTRTLLMEHALRGSASSLPSSLLPALQASADELQAQANRLLSVQFSLEAASYDRQLDALVLGRVTYVGHPTLELSHEAGDWRLTGHGDEVVVEPERCDMQIWW
jgi:hypothetical protein